MTKEKARIGLEQWNRKIHTYLGLYMILFLWLFSISGLVMNHPKWFGHHVDRVPSERSLTIPEETDPVARAKALQKQLGLDGEIILKGQRKPDHFIFMIMRPQLRFAIDVELNTGKTKINRVTPATAQILGQMHTFSGVRAMWNEPAQEKDWIITRLWSFSMDAICIGLIVMVLSSLYMGYQLKEKRRWIILSFGLGLLVCAYFVWGLSMMA